MTDREFPLAGGNVNAVVVRVGDTVRRIPSAHSASVHMLLRHLESANLSFVPRFLGIDDQGREILTFIPGQSAFPEEMWTSDAALVASVDMLKRFHDATEPLLPDITGDWAYKYPDRARHEVICHNDFAPYNMIFDAGVPIGLVDFDLAGPGPRLRDLAYLAYWMVPLSFADGDMQAYALADLAAGCPRLLQLCARYGTPDVAGLLDMVSEVLVHMSDRAAAETMIGPKAAARLAEGKHFEHWEKEAGAFEATKQALAAALVGTAD